MFDNVFGPECWSLFSFALLSEFNAGFLAATLTIYIKLVASDTITVSTTIFWTFTAILIAGLVAIVLLLSTQPKGNAIFSFNRSHPLFPAIILFGCIYLCTAIDVAAWIRLAVWIAIGKFCDSNLFCNKFSNRDT